MKRLGECRWQEVLTQEGEHLPDFYVSAFEATELGHKAPGLATHERGFFLPATQLLKRTTNGQRATGSKTGNGHSETAAQRAAFQGWGWLTHGLLYEQGPA